MTMREHEIETRPDIDDLIFEQTDHQVSER